ncbi:hypothetical protein RFI_06662 [Reticulomyxa filosa]|uniref:Uncharacterized protein n=1 Tax=Reticulomyxa filosa TaxID=46433 RepID=X6NYW1_RETFI|nr:hypothetical protein RFI_06662 [Reticulomyxa filosa]|eukprot:ETO30457.1 hypothetical protein RFI_06662 [Reticulomyxa filosa]
MLILIWLQLIIGIIRSQTTIQYATADPTLEGYLQDLLGSDYQLPENVYEWNETLIVAIIDRKAPGLLCNTDRSFYGGFPEIVIIRLPVKILFCQEFYCLIPENVLISNYSTNYTKLGVNCSNYTIEDDIGNQQSCPLPLVESKAGYFGLLLYMIHIFVFCIRVCFFWAYDLKVGKKKKKGGGGGLKYDTKRFFLVTTTKIRKVCGISPQTLQILRTIKITSCAVGVLFLIVLVMNQVADHRRQKIPFWERGILHHSSTMITISWIIVLTTFALIEIVGLDNVLCADNGSKSRVLSLNNPKAGWIPCLLAGIAIYGSELTIGNYSIAFSLSLWHQFYRPLKHSLMSQFHINCDWLDTLLMRVRIRSIPFDSRDDSSVSVFKPDWDGNKCTVFKYKLERRLRATSFSETSCGRCCVGCICASSFKWHILMWIVTLSFLLGAIIQNTFGAYHPTSSFFLAKKKKKNKHKKNVYSLPHPPLLIITMNHIV